MTITENLTGVVKEDHERVKTVTDILEGKGTGIKKKRERITTLLLKCKKSDHKKPTNEKKEQ